MRYIIISLVTSGLVGLFVPPWTTAEVMSLTATWDLNDPREEVKGYNLYYKYKIDTEYKHKINADLLPPESHTGGYQFNLDVTPGRILQFVLTAVNPFGESGYSEPATLPIPLLPSNPKKLQLKMDLKVYIP